MYAVLSAIREDWPYSVSPGGLSFGGGNATYYPEQEEQGYIPHPLLLQKRQAST